MTREDMLAALSRKPVPFQAAGLSVFVKPFTAATRFAFGAWRRENKDSPLLFAKLFVLSVCAADGTPVFADTPEDLAAVADLDGRAVEAVGLRALELNGDDPGNSSGESGPK